MKITGFALAAMLTVTAQTARAEDLSVEDWINQFVDLCVGSGTSTIASGDVDADAGITLRSLKLSGSLAGKVKLERKDYRLLTDGISNAMSEAAADQADKVRECLEPIRRQLLAAMKIQIGLPSSTTTNGPVVAEILSPDEEKIVKALSQTEGSLGTGRGVENVALKEHVGLGDIRLRVALKSLGEKMLVIQLGFTQSALTDRGDEYALEMGYAQ